MRELETHKRLMQGMGAAASRHHRGRRRWQPAEPRESEEAEGKQDPRSIWKGLKQRKGSVGQQNVKQFGEPSWGEGQCTPGTRQVHVDIWSTEARQGAGERAAAVKKCGYEGSNPNFIGEVREAETDLDSAEEMATGRFRDS